MLFVYFLFNSPVNSLIEKDNQKIDHKVSNGHFATALKL